MKTKPVDNILPLPMDEDSQRVMNLYHDAIHELVCYGTHLLDWSLKPEKKAIDSDTEATAVVSLLFRHILEIIDGVSVQIKAGVIDPCNIQLRSVVEALLYLEYMLKEETQKRVMCYLIVDVYRNYNLTRKHIGDTKEYNEYISILKEGTLAFNEDIISKDGEVPNKSYEDFINQPKYNEINKEYLRLSKNNNIKKAESIKWYEFFGGPGSIYMLAFKLKRLDLYDFIYKSYSNASHGSELWKRNLTVIDNEFGGIKQIRNLEEAHKTTITTIIFGVKAFELLTGTVLMKHRKNFNEWFRGFDRNHYEKIRKTELEFE